MSAFGGIVAVNRPVDAELAREMAETFLECVIAPDFTPPRRWRAVRGQEEPAAAARARSPPVRPARSSSAASPAASWCRPATAPRGAAPQGQVVSRAAAHAGELARSGLRLAGLQARQVERHRLRQPAARTLGIGAGQMSRVDSVRIAVSKARAPLAGSVVASDAFFPFRDGVDEAAKAGATAIIQPGGSVRDQEVIAAADEHGMAMVFTGERHFRH